MIDFLLKITGIEWLYNQWAISQEMKRHEEEERLFQQNLKNLRQQPEFCLSCGAGIGKFRREGEGTCPECDPSIADERT